MIGGKVMRSGGGASPSRLPSLALHPPLSYSARRPAGGNPLWAARLNWRARTVYREAPAPERAFCH
jgi:hypothetical protein